MLAVSDSLVRLPPPRRHTDERLPQHPTFDVTAFDYPHPTNTDRGHKATIATEVRQSPRKYAASFRSELPRLPEPSATQLQRLQLGAHTAMNYNPGSSFRVANPLRCSPSFKGERRPSRIIQHLGDHFDTQRPRFAQTPKQVKTTTRQRRRSPNHSPTFLPMGADSLHPIKQQDKVDQQQLGTTKTSPPVVAAAHRPSKLIVQSKKRQLRSED